MNTDEPLDNQPAPYNRTQAEPIPIKFTPVQAEVLKEGSATDGLILAKSVHLQASGKEIDIELYQVEEPDQSNEVYAFLVDNEKRYEIGIVSSYGFDDSLHFQARDLTGDGQAELITIGSQGATYVELKVISYMADQWVNLLTMGSPEFVDLDQDGHVELLATSRGSLPPYVLIYTWNHDHFEQADVAEQLKLDYATLADIDGMTVIQSGTMNSNSYYQYQDQSLTLIEEKNKVPSNLIAPSNVIRTLSKPYLSLI